MEAVRDEYSFSDLSVISVHRETVKIDANRKVTLHCIEFNGDTSTMWCSSQEIAHLIPVWGGRDLLAEMLVVKNVLVERKILDKQKNGQILRELVKLGVKGVSEHHEVSLYKVANIKYFVRLFNNNG